MKKRITILSILLALTLSFIIAYVIQKENNNSYILEHKEAKDNSNLSIMVETSAGSGSYTKNNNIDWTTGDYELNLTKSSCANNSVLKWDDTTYQVSMSGSSSDSCTLYFDRAVKIVVESSNKTATYNGAPQTINLSSSTPGAVPYYSLSPITKTNYKTSGSTTHPTVTNAGTTTVYWCVECNTSVKCGENDIVISKATPTLTVSNSNPTVTSTSTITYTYNGDGVVTCSPTSGTYGNCSVNTSNKTITLTRKSNGNQNVTISAAEGTNYNATSIVIPVVFCFTEDTEVDEWDRKKKKKRKKKIKDIKVGDIVYAYDYMTDQLVTRKVEKVHVAKTNEICHIFVNGEDIKTTRDHPFYVKDVGFMEASLLRPGFELAAGNGTYYTVEKVEYESLETPVEMYCFELEDGSSFVVGNLGIAAKTIFAATLGITLMNVKTRIVAASS